MSEIIEGIIMGRRVSWLGHARKMDFKDCVVVNFNTSTLAGGTLTMRVRVVASCDSIQAVALDLGFFFPPPVPKVYYNPEQEIWSKPFSYHSNANLLLHYPVADIPVQNRYACLSTLDNNA